VQTICAHNLIEERIMNKQDLLKKLSSIITEAKKGYNKGQKYERDLIAAMEKQGIGSKGVLSQRGADAIVKIHTNQGMKHYKLSIKADNAAAGQMQFSHSRKNGWSYDTKEESGKHLAHAMIQAGLAGDMDAHYKTPKTANHLEHVKSAGELHINVGRDVDHVAQILHHGTNHDDLMHIKGKGTYAMTPGIAKETGIDYIGTHIDMENDPLTLRHRVKTHSSAKDGKPATRSLTAQLNFNKNALRSSSVDLEEHGLGEKIMPDVEVPHERRTDD
jgi:hypothetical protein